MHEHYFRDNIFAHVNCSRAPILAVPGHSTQVIYQWSASKSYHLVSKVIHKYIHNKWSDGKSVYHRILYFKCITTHLLFSFPTGNIVSISIIEEQINRVGYLSVGAQDIRHVRNTPQPLPTYLKLWIVTAHYDKNN